jgi:4-amino-4-deoxy-L-arabinose transferase-like glycosyltransferase
VKAGARPGARSISAAVGAALFVALALRLFALAAASGRTPSKDPLLYVDMAHSVLAGHGLVVVQGPFVARALFPPVYPLLLAAIGTVAPLTPAIIALLNSLIDVGAAFLLYQLARQLDVPRAALPAAIAYLCWPSITLAAPLANKESLSIFLLLAALVCILERANGGGRRWIVSSGVSAGLMVLTQPAIALVLPILFVLLRNRFASRRAWLTASLGAALCALLVLLPWWIRNYLLFDAFVPLTTSTGQALWVGAQPGGGFRWQPFPLVWLGQSELQLNHTAASAAWRIIADDPWAYVQRCLVKLPASFLRPNLSVLNLAFLEPPPWPGVLRSKPVQLVPMLVELVPVALSLVGLVTLCRSLAARLLLGCIAASLLFGIWFEFSERHRLFMTPFLLLLAVMTVEDMWRAAKSAPRGAE